MRTSDAHPCGWQRRTVPFPEHVGPGRQPANEIDECDDKGRDRVPAISAQGISRKSRADNGWGNQPGGRPPGCVAQPPPWRAARLLSCGQFGGEADDGCGQVGVRTRHKRLVDPRVELVLGQPALHERDLEGVDHLLAVGVRSPQVTAARHSRRIPVGRVPAYRIGHTAPPRDENPTTEQRNAAPLQRSPSSPGAKPRVRSENQRHQPERTRAFAPPADGYVMAAGHLGAVRIRHIAAARTRNPIAAGISYQSMIGTLA
jgi:hypothetical protein